VLSDEALRALLATCAGTDFTARRDTAIIMLFLDGGLRLSELAGLQVTDVDLRDRIVYVIGKASRRSGPGIVRFRSESRRRGRWTDTSASGAGIRTRTRRGCGWAAAAGRPWRPMAWTRC
jgi:integrase